MAINLSFLRIRASFSEKMDCGVYKIDSTYVELSEVRQSFGVVRVNSAVKAFRFIMKQSYICALIAMMVSPARQSSLSVAVLDPLFSARPPAPNLVITHDKVNVYHVHKLSSWVPAKWRSPDGDL